MWPAWADILLGGCGLIWCLDTWKKLQTREPWAPHLVLTTRLLAIFSVGLLIGGAIRWVQNPGS